MAISKHGWDEGGMAYVKELRDRPAPDVSPRYRKSASKPTVRHLKQRLAALEKKLASWPEQSGCMRRFYAQVRSGYQNKIDKTKREIERAES